MADIASLGLCHQQVLSTLCSTKPCPYEHDFELCRDCGVVSVPASDGKKHRRTKAHKRKIGRFDTLLVCTVCSKMTPGHRWQSHIDSPQHLREAEALRMRHVEPQRATSDPRFIYCDACDVHVPTAYRTVHTGETLHINMVRMKAYIAAIQAGSEVDVAIKRTADIAVIEDIEKNDSAKRHQNPGFPN